MEEQKSDGHWHHVPSSDLYFKKGEAIKKAKQLARKWPTRQFGVVLFINGAEPLTVLRQCVRDFEHYDLDFTSANQSALDDKSGGRYKI